ncbi:MAG: hypothetical protein HYY84_02905 [Deltaproteobacteria bacterium]|nr:hypothetical protein [Deltaproteobacteria bacterium]
MPKLSPRACRALRQSAIVIALMIVAALAFAYYLIYYKSPEYRRLAREADETQRALDALGDEADGGTHSVRATRAPRR